MRLWINPFLDNFYEWGLGKYWHDKFSFIVYLDEGYRGADIYLNTEESEGWDEEGEEIQEYLKKNTPEWYWRYGFSFTCGSLWDVGLLNPGGDELTNALLNAWENDKPFRFPGSDSISRHIISPEIYVGYPEELKSDGEMLNLYEYYSGYSESEDATPSVQMVWIDINEGHHRRLLFNSLYFTAQKGESWCKLSLQTNFINWTDENPLEGKE